MPRQSAARQQQHHQQSTNSFSVSADSSTSYLSARSKTLSPRSNFNPFSPLSPHQGDKELDISDDDSGAMFQMEGGAGTTRASRLYTREKLLAISNEIGKRAYLKPQGMRDVQSLMGPSQDPAIISMGAPPNRKNGGYEQGFGFGGGIAVKGPSRVGRQQGPPRRNDHESHGHAQAVKDASATPMGKFSVKPSGDKMRLGGDEHRRPKDDWRRDKPPHQAQRNDRRQWNARTEEDNVEPAWMDDQPEHDPAIIQNESLAQYIPAEDRIAAHKRAMRGGADGKPLVGFFNHESPVVTPTKPVKEHNAANYLLPSKSRRPDQPDLLLPKENASTSRFTRFFGNPAHNDGPDAMSPPIASPPIVSPPIISPPTESPARSAQPPAEERHNALLMNLLNGSRSSAGTSTRPPVHSPSPPPVPSFQHQLPYLSQPYGMMPPGIEHTFRPGPQYFSGHDQQPMQQHPQQHHPHQQHNQQHMQHPYGGQPPPHMYHQQQAQGFLPPPMMGGRPPFPPPPPPGFAPDGPQYYSHNQGHLPQEAATQQQPMTQQQRNMSALLGQFSQQQSR